MSKITDNRKPRDWKFYLYLIIANFCLLASIAVYQTAYAVPTEATLQVLNECDDRYQNINTGTIIDDTNLLKIVSEYTDVRSAFRFTGTEIDQGENINSANLSFYINYNNFGSNNHNVTIYGHKNHDIPRYNYSHGLYPFGTPRTSASYTIDLASYGTGWVNITVTDIVQELVRQFRWNADLIEGTASGFSLGISAIQSESSREIHVFPSETGSGNAPRLYLSYGEPDEDVSGLPDDAVYWKTVNGKDIYNYSETCYIDFTNFTEIDLDGVMTVNKTHAIVTNFANGGNTPHIETDHLYEFADGDWFYYGFSLARNPNGAGGWANYFFQITDTLGIYSHQFLRTQADGADPIDLIYQGGYTTAGGEFTPLTEGQRYFMRWDLIDIPDNNVTISIFNTEEDAFTANYSEAVDIHSSALNNDYPPETRQLKICRPLTTAGMTVTQMEVFNFYMNISADIPETNDSFYLVENGTIIFTNPDYDEIIDYIEGVWEEDPEDPDPPTWEDSPISRFNMKTMIFTSGFLLMILPLLYGAASKPPVETWTIIAFCFMAGWAILNYSTTL